MLLVKKREHLIIFYPTVLHTSISTENSQMCGGCVFTGNRCVSFENYFFPGYTELRSHFPTSFSHYILPNKLVLMLQKLAVYLFPIGLHCFCVVMLYIWKAS